MDYLLGLKSAFRQAFPLSHAFVMDESYPKSAIAAQMAGYVATRSPLMKAIDELLCQIDFDTEAQTIEPENIEKTKQTFFEFLDAANLPLSRFAFEDILKENTGEFAYRGDGITPNWYHFFRQVIPKLSMIKSGRVSPETLDQHGGLDALIAATLYHDSWEDHGRHPGTIIADYKRRIDALFVGDTSRLKEQASIIGNLVDLCSRQIPVVKDGKFVLKEGGKIVKQQRFNGDMNTYHNGHLEHPFALWIKWDDGTEGTSTRLLEDTFERKGKEKFSVISNMKYAGKIRAFYGRRANDALAIAKWPEFEKVFRSADCMLGINLVTLESLNDYAVDKNLNPQNAQPQDVTTYINDAWDGHKYVPPGWRADRIQTDRIEMLAQARPRTREILDHVIYPAIRPFTMDMIDPQKQPLIEPPYSAPYVE